MSEFKKYNHQHYYYCVLDQGKQLTCVIITFNQYNHLTRQVPTIRIL